ncbi:Asp23/Gls24 family envelope stress response protein [Micromonospora sonneratiae]|uniref:Asp23/Gls24 family envelope stress response protein n=1 Tax=Micromonospora sonneratiae TaxID=1184706 RepID=A0ABW3YDI3_9ACTN
MTDTTIRYDGRAGLRPQLEAPPAGSPPYRAQLTSDVGRTRISEAVVSKIAGLAAREIPGVYAMGAAAMRGTQTHGPVTGDAHGARRGVSVEVGEREAAIDLDIVTWYGQSVVDVCDAVRRNVIDRIEATTGLKVVEVNITVDDVHVEGDDELELQGP